MGPSPLPELGLLVGWVVLTVINIVTEEHRPFLKGSIISARLRLLFSSTIISKLLMAAQLSTNGWLISSIDGWVNY